jgi:hypothetical protein
VVGPAFFSRRLVALLVVALQVPIAGAIASAASADPSTLGNQTITTITGTARTDSLSTFGESVALSSDGLRALVDEPFRDRLSTGQALDAGHGAVAVLTRADASSPWTNEGDLPHTPQLDDRFGLSLALSGDGTVALASYYDHVQQHDVVEAYERTSSGWDGPQTVYEGQHLYLALALDGDGTTGIVVDSKPPLGASSGTGGIHVFQRSGAAWTERQYLAAAIGAPEAVDVSTDGLTVAYQTTVPTVAHRASKVDDFDSGQSLPSTGTYRQFSMDAAGRTIVGSDRSGAMHAVTVWARANDGSWSVQATIPEEADSWTFGTAVALDASGSRLAIGDRDYEPVPDPARGNIGRVSIYERDGASWTRAGEVASPNPHPLEMFGSTLDFAADGATLLIGTHDLNRFVTPSVYVWSSDIPTSGDPVAVDDTATTTQTAPVAIDLVANDLHVAGEQVTTPAASASGGTVHDDGNGHVTYTPPEPFVGTDHFTYSLCTSGAPAVCDSATVTVTVHPIAMFDAQHLANHADDGVPYVADFNADRRDDVFWDAPGSAHDSLWIAGSAGFSVRTVPAVAASLQPIIGNFNGDRRADVLWWSPTSAREVLWLGKTTGFWVRSVPAVSGSYRPFTGDFNGDGHDDVFWYAPGTTREALWYGDVEGFRVANVGSIDATYQPVVGDFNGNGRADILWYAARSTREMLWYGAARGFGTAAVGSVNATFTPLVGDFDGDHRADVLWYAPGTAREALWRGAATGFTGVTVPRVDGTFTARVGDFNGDGRDDIYWYAPGPAAEMLWRGGNSFTALVAPAQAGSYVTRVADCNGDGRADLLFVAHARIGNDLWYGLAS